MPKKPPFPIGLTLDEALQKGWRPGFGSRRLIVTDDGPIREAGPGDVWLDPADPANRPRRRRSSGGDTPMARVKAAMKRYRAAERERRRKWKSKRAAAKTAVRFLPPPAIDELASAHRLPSPSKMNRIQTIDPAFERGLVDVK